MLLLKRFQCKCGAVSESILRRDFLAHLGSGMGGVALSWLLAREGLLAADAKPQSPLAPRAPHFPAKAKRILHIFCVGAVSHVDTFDYKPGLQAEYDKELPESVRKGQRITTMTSGQSRFPVAPSKFITQVALPWMPILCSRPPQ